MSVSLFRLMSLERPIDHCIWLSFCVSTDMLQLINNQDMEFGGLFDNTFPTPPTLTQELSVTPHSSSSSPLTSSTPPTTSSILSSSPHLDALLGPPITRSSSVPDKAFQPSTFQQSPLTQTAATPANPTTLQPKAQPALSPNLPPATPVTQSHAAPIGKSPVFGSTQQTLFSTPAPQLSVATFPNQNSYPGECFLFFLTF